MVPGDEDDQDDVDHHHDGVQVCGGLAGAALEEERGRPRAVSGAGLCLNNPLFLVF